MLVPQYLKAVEIGADVRLAQCLASRNKMRLIPEDPYDSQNQYFLKDQALSMLGDRAAEGVGKINGW